MHICVKNTMRKLQILNLLIQGMPEHIGIHQEMSFFSFWHGKILLLNLSTMAESFLSIAEKGEIEKNEALTKELVYFFNELKKVGAEFGYRSATEIMQLATKLKILEPSVTDDDCLDIAIMQKLLPKLHGSRSKLVKILIALAGLCIEGIKKEDFEKNFEDLYKKDFEDINVKYPISFEKLIRMYKNVLANGFTSYAEA